MMRRTIRADDDDDDDDNDGGGEWNWVRKAAGG